MQSKNGLNTLKLDLHPKMDREKDKHSFHKRNFRDVFNESMILAKKEKVKTNKRDSITLKSYYTVKETTVKIKRQLIKWKK